MAKSSVTPKLDPRAVAEAVSQELDTRKPVKLADTEHYIDSGWRNSPLNMAISNRLLKVDRCLTASRVMQELLHRDAIAKQDIADLCDEDEVTLAYPVLSYDEADGLFMGMQELMMQARESLRSIREDEYSIATKQSQGVR